ncbi:C-type lectin domain containing protein [Aphelenchoides fujianensis]|nr:C-type lectin domain containing protein [Aphelenchoides fujianensis]
MRARILFFLFLVLPLASGSLCPEGAIPGFTEDASAICYLFERFPAQFTTAEQLCRDSDGHLASVGDLLVNDFVAQGAVEAFEVMGVSEFFVGGHDLEAVGKWKWFDGSAFNFTNWKDGEPKGNSRNRCISMSLDDGRWIAVDCYESKQYVCEVGAIATTAAPTAQSTITARPTTSIQTTHPTAPPNTKHPKTTKQPKGGPCEDGWAYFKHTELCYKIVENADDCYADWSTREATVHSKKENDFIGGLAAKLADGNVQLRLSAMQVTAVGRELAAETSSPQKPWIERLGAKKPARSAPRPLKKRADDWTWVDGTPLDFENWAPDEPKDFGGFNCLELNTCLKGKKCKKEDKHNAYSWTSTSCLLRPKYAVCSKSP